MKFLKNASMTVRLIAVAMALALLMGAYVKQQSPSIMTTAAKNFINSLEPWQKTAVSFKMEDEERANWFYTPVPRKGLALHDMKPYQRQLAMAMLGAGLSQRGFIKAVTIMSLDEILLVTEPAPRRDPDNYYISIFGEPSETGEWGYRFEGHHVSQNFTLVNGKVQGAPSFFGSNPAEVLDGPRKGLRVLAAEEDLALAVVNSLTPDQRKTAIYDTKAPGDILTTNSRDGRAQRPAQRSIRLGDDSGAAGETAGSARRILLEHAGSDCRAPRGANQKGWNEHLVRLGWRNGASAAQLLPRPDRRFPG